MQNISPSEMSTIYQISQRIYEQVGRVIVGKDEVIELLLVALFCEGHVLLEDVPGIGKTTLAKTLARTLGCSFSRIQFTPDLLPSDITGVNVFNQKSGEFEYRPGPVMAQIVLADEINRAKPRTQSALLEAMQERQVTVDGVTRPLPYPFIVLATQNPVELEGTFPLPEAQVDRFLMRLALGYPELEEERQILHRFRTADPLSELEPLVSTEDLHVANAICRQVYIHQTVENYLLALVRASRLEPTVALGISPRGTLALYRASQAFAAIHGRDYMIPDDVKRLAMPVLGHRVILNADARLRGATIQATMTQLIEQTPVPVEERWSEGVPTLAQP